MNIKIINFGFEMQNSKSTYKTSKRTVQMIKMTV